MPVCLPVCLFVSVFVCQCVCLPVYCYLISEMKAQTRSAGKAKVILIGMSGRSGLMTCCTVTDSVSATVRTLSQTGTQQKNKGVKTGHVINISLSM